MKRPVFLILGVALGLAGCGGSNSSSQSAAAQATAAASVAEAPAAAGAANPSDLPLYPGATKSAFDGSGVTLKRCGFTISTTMYDVNGADAGTVTNWYVAHIPGGNRVDNKISMGNGASVAFTEILEPSGAAGAGVSFTNMGNIPVPKTGPLKNAGGVHVVLVTYNPALTPDMMQEMHDAMGTDPAAKQAAIAKIRAKCGPNSVPVGM